MLLVALADEFRIGGSLPLRLAVRELSFLDLACDLLQQVLSLQHQCSIDCHLQEGELKLGLAARLQPSYWRLQSSLQQLRRVEALGEVAEVEARVDLERLM